MRFLFWRQLSTAAASMLFILFTCVMIADAAHLTAVPPSGGHP